MKTCPLELISFLKKLCNHPDLVTICTSDDEGNFVAGHDVDTTKIAPDYVVGTNQLQFVTACSMQTAVVREFDQTRHFQILGKTDRR